MDVTVGLVDLKRREVTPLGGAGTKELRNPATTFVRADTLHVGDWGLRRTTLWTLAGKLVRTIPTADAARGALPRARDAAGNFYMELLPAAGTRWQRQSRLRRGRPALAGSRPVRYRRATVAARHGGGQRRRGPPVRAQGVERCGSLGRAAGRIGVGGAGVRQPGGVAQSRRNMDPRRPAARPRPRGHSIRPRAVLSEVPARAPKHRRAAAVRRSKAAVRGRLHVARPDRSGWRRAGPRRTRPAATTRWTARGVCSARCASPDRGGS